MQPVFRFVATLMPATFVNSPAVARMRRQSRRLLSLAAVYGMSRGEAARIGMDRQPCGTGFTGSTKRDRMASPTARARAGRAGDVQMKELGEIVETGPDPAVDGVVRWRRIDLKRVIEARFGVIYSERGISRLLGELGFAHISARPQHPRQDKRIIEAFKKTSPTRFRCADLPAGTPVEIWFQTKHALAKELTRLWARKGTRPRQPADQRYHNASSVRLTARGRRSCCLGRTRKPCRCDEISRHVARKAHAVVLMDRAGWHTTGKLKVPKNLTIILLPSRAPELLWQYLRANWLSNRSKTTMPSSGVNSALYKGQLHWPFGDWLAFV